MRCAIGTDHAWLAINIEYEVERDEYLDYITFKSNSRPLFTEIFGPLVGLKEEWMAQGASEAELDLSAFHYRAPKRAFLPLATGWIGGTSPRTLEETEEYAITLDSMGRTMKLVKGVATIPLPLSYPVETMDDWLRIKCHYEYSPERMGAWRQAARDHIEAKCVSIAGIPGGFDEPRQLLGEENVCLAFYEQPELIHDILNTIGDTVFKMLEEVTREHAIDELFVHEDMAGKSGPLIGPSQVREFIRPYYRKVWDMLQERGARVFSQDSDGDMRPVIPAFIDCGINLMYPCEPAAGMDIVQLRERYGNSLAFMGGIDKFVLRRSKEEIAAELEYKIPPMMRSGGCILGLDHRIPNGTPLENYRFYIQKVWEIFESVV